MDEQRRTEKAAESDGESDVPDASEKRAKASTRKRAAKPKDDSMAGAHLSVDHGGRAVKAYPVTESELRTMTFINSFAGVAFGVGGFFLGLFVEIFIDASFSDKLSIEAALLLKFGPWIFGILSAASFVAGVLAVVFRSSTWKDIKKSTQFLADGK